MIDRKTYLEMCQKCANYLYNASKGTTPPKGVMVNYEGTSYYPLSYSISFDRYGTPIHKVVLLDKNGNSINGAYLKDIERVEE